MFLILCCIFKSLYGTLYSGSAAIPKLCFVLNLGVLGHHTIRISSMRFIGFCSNVSEGVCIGFLSIAWVISLEPSNIRCCCICHITSLWFSYCLIKGGYRHNIATILFWFQRASLISQYVYMHMIWNEKILEVL